MASTSKFSGVTSDPGTEVHPLSSGVAVPAKSYIVGKYDQDGRRKLGGALVEGSPEAGRLTKLLVKSMSTRGGELMPGFIMTADGPRKVANLPKPAPILKQAVVKGKKGKKKVETATEDYIQTITDTVTQPEPVQYQGNMEPVKEKAETFPVVFVVESGTIKTSTEAILEDDLGLILVYGNEDAISYVPKRGGHLTLILPGKREVSVMYLGIQLRWYDSEQQLLIFVKTKPSE